MRKHRTLLSAAVIIIVLVFISSVAHAATTTVTVPKQKSSTNKTSLTTSGSVTTTKKPVKKTSKSKTTAGYKRPVPKSRIASYATPKPPVTNVAPPEKQTIQREQTKSTSRVKGSNNFDLGFDVKPYLAIVILLISALKTGFRKNSLATVRNRSYWEANHVNVSRRKISSSYF